jgi:hypothetical protein
MEPYAKRRTLVEQLEPETVRCGWWFTTGEGELPERAPPSSNRSP